MSLQNEIQKDKDKIMSQKNVLSQEELQKKTIDLEKKAKSYNDRMSKKNNELNIYGNKAKVEFYNQLTKIVAEYAAKNSIEMIVKKENILIGKTNLDATPRTPRLIKPAPYLVKILPIPASNLEKTPPARTLPSISYK